MDNGQERKKTIEDSMTEQVHLIMQQHLQWKRKAFWRSPDEMDR